jgi:hypothetical protein
LVAVELRDVYAMVSLGRLLGKDDPQRFVWFGRAAANGNCCSFLKKMEGQIRKFSRGTGQAEVVFVIGRALKGHIDNETRIIFGSVFFYVQPFRKSRSSFLRISIAIVSKTVDSWTIVGLRNKVVKDIRTMIGKMIWDTRDDAVYLEEK